MIERLAIIGASGDLTARFLLPALASLHQAGELSQQFQLVAASRDDWDDATFRRWAADQLDLHAPELGPAAKEAVVASARYHQVDVTNADSMRPLIAGGEPVAAYLALPPSVFPPAVASLHAAGMPPGSTIVLEKPFGESLEEAIELNLLLASLLPEEAVFRVDHFLAMSTVQNVLGTRLANRVLEPIWNSSHIAEIEIVWDETLGLEGRAGYYDGVGALKDMIQNHLLQLLCLVAMEPPISLDQRGLRDRKVDVLRSIRPLDEADVLRTRRGRYTAGTTRGHAVPSYVDEEGVDPARGTETFAEIQLAIDNWRWPDTVFRLRTGKALSRDRMEVAVHFRDVPHLPFLRDREVQPNVLRFGLEPENVSLELTGVGSKAGALSPLILVAQLQPGRLPAYGRLLLDVLNRDAALSIRGDEAEESWRVVEPVIDAWSKNLVPIQDYRAGSNGPLGLVDRAMHVQARGA
jgi:glucose-6-phosphate 1-dehydrogenase